jgi:RHS repeat-associated protein
MVTNLRRTVRSRLSGRTRAPGRFSRPSKLADPAPRTAISGRRYYSPNQGRFLGRDPKAEAGGLNLYGFCRNNSVNLWDYLGMKVLALGDVGGANDTPASGLVLVDIGGGRVMALDPSSMPPYFVTDTSIDPFLPLDLDERGSDYYNDLFGVCAGAAGGGPPTYNGYRIVQSVDQFYGTGKSAKTFVNPEMGKGLGTDSGDGTGMRAHLQARGLTVTNATSASAILSILDGSKSDVLTIGAHGASGYINMVSAIDVFGKNNITARDSFWGNLRDFLNPGATIVIVGCNFGGDDEGIADMQLIANATGATIVAPTGAYVIDTAGPTLRELSPTAYATITPNKDAPQGLVGGYIVVPPKGKL